MTRIRAAGIKIDHLDTHHHLGFLPAVGRAVEVVAQRHGIGAIRSAIESTVARVGDRSTARPKAGVLTGLGWLTRRQLGARRHGAQSWGYVESGRLDEVRVLEIIGRLGPGPHELICHPGEERTPFYDHAGELTALTLGEGAPRDRPARDLPLPLGRSVLSGVREPDAPNEAAAAPEPYVPPQTSIAELSAKAVALGIAFGVIFGAATVYLALKAGLTVSASIPIAVLAISVFKKLGSSTILENNIVQTIGSAGESIAAGVVFTLPGFLFLGSGASPGGHGVGEPYFSYWTILTLAMVGGVLGVLMMIPLRRSLIVQEHANLPYPEGTACASVLIAGEKGGNLARTAYHGLGVAFVYAFLQRVVRVIAETPALALKQSNAYLPAAVVSADITPEYLGVGYIIGPRIAGVLVAGGVLAWLGMIPLITVLTPPDRIAAQLVKLGYLASIGTPGGPGGWDPVTHSFASAASAVYRAYVRQIGAGAVAAGGFITLLKTLPTIVSSFKESIASLRRRDAAAAQVLRTERDLPITVVLVGSLVLVLVIALLPFVPGAGVGSKVLIGLLVVIFGFFFVTVASRVVGLIGSSSNPISGMTIATLMATCLVFVGLGWTGDVYQPMALCVGAIVCIAAANAGATSQDLKTGFLVGATPRAQQIGLLIGVITSTSSWG